MPKKFSLEKIEGEDLFFKDEDGNSFMVPKKVIAQDILEEILNVSEE